MSEGLYESEWYVFDKSNRQILLGMIMRSQRPLYLTAGQFYNVTLETFLSVSIFNKIMRDLSHDIAAYCR